jgi:hypothetical protein
MFENLRNLFEAAPPPKSKSPSPRRHQAELKGLSVKIDSKTYPLRDLCLSGFMVEPYQGDLIEKQRVYLNLILNHGEHRAEFRTEALVVRIENNALVGRFTDLRRDAQRAIEALLGDYAVRGMGQPIAAAPGRGTA